MLLFECILFKRVEEGEKIFIFFCKIYDSIYIDDYFDYDKNK